MKLKKLLLFCFSSILFSFYGYSQDATIKGKVTGDGGSPLPGVSVLVKGTSKGTTTDFDGTYQIKAPTNGTLVFSYIGYNNQAVSIDGRTAIDVKLKAEAEALKEIVVVGYGTQKATKVSGAISSVKAVEIERLKPVRVEEALQGAAAGVSVIQNGSPGSKPTVLIRGIPSFSGTDPAVIIDGSPQSLGDLNAINAADIESINVLKDAASTAIYGVKGGNGVILVTTKIGKKNQKVELTFNTSTGEQQVFKKLGVLNATEYGAMLNEASVAGGAGLIFPNLSVLGVGTNWQDQVFKTALSTNNNFTARGGGEKMSYFVSASYLTQGGIVGGDDKSNFNRLNLTANLNFDLTSKLKLILNTSYVNIKDHTIGENSFNSILGTAINYDPTVPVYNTVPNTIGQYGFSNLILSELKNPLTQLANTYNEGNGNKLYGKLELQYELIKNLKINSRFGYSKWDRIGKTFTPLGFYGVGNVMNELNADGTTVTGKHNSVSETSDSNFNYTIENFASYNFKLNQKHNFDLVAGISESKVTSSGFNIRREDVPFNSWNYADVAYATGVSGTTGYTGLSYQNITRKNLSYFGRVNYDYQDKYLASFSGRRDGSIAFGKENKFGNFYAGSLGWVVSKEDFFKSETINLFKIRGSYGSVGNENVDPQYVSISNGGPSYNSTANSNGYTFNGTGAITSGSTVNTYANETLHWEKQIQGNVGFDLNAFNNKLTISADYFDKKVDGQLFTATTPGYAGTSEKPKANIGTTKSSGIDATLGYKTETVNGFKFNTSVTFTTSKNLVVSTNLDGTADIKGGGYFNGQSQQATRYALGETPGYFYGFKTAGIFQSNADIAAWPKYAANSAKAQPGDIKFVDVNGDGTIDDLDKTKIGDPFPKFTMGWNLNLEYKGVDLSVFTYASVGNDIYNATDRNQQATNKTRDILDRWTAPNSTNDARYPRVTIVDTNINTRVSDRYVSDGSFVKIKNIVLGYTLPFKSQTISKIRVYAQVKNLYTFTKYTGLDPEISGTGDNNRIMEAGVDRGSYPQARTFLAGIDLKF